MNETIPTVNNSHARRKRSIYYYQWLPILLAFQSLLFLIPRLIWSSFSSRCGIDLQHCLAPQFDYRTSRYKVHHITTMLNLLARAKQYDYNRSSSNGSLNRKSFASNFHLLRSFCIPFFCLNENPFHGFYLANLFLIVKLLFLINSSLQLLFLNTLLTKNSMFYGLEVLENFYRGEYIVGSRIFPLSVYCDFNIVKIGQPTLYTVRRQCIFHLISSLFAKVQCLLPMNVFNEKIFTIIWFWLVFLTVNNLKSVLLTIARSNFRHLNYSYIANYLDLYSKKERFKRHLLVKRFIFDYLSADGILILRLISENISDLLTSEVINELWLEYKKMSNLSPSNREKYQRLKALNQTRLDVTPSHSRSISHRHSLR